MERYHKISFRTYSRGKENENNNYLSYKKAKTESNNQSDSNALNIFLRVRPLKEMEERCLEVMNNQIILKPSNTQFNGRGQTKVFDFNQIFQDNATQEDVFQNSIFPLLNSIQEGRDLLFFAYGVTGAGKTFTIEGTETNPGILPRTISCILSSIQKGIPYNFQKYSELKVTCFEIFNEKLYDLLAPSSKDSKKGKKGIISNFNQNQEFQNRLEIGRDSDGKTIVEGATSIIIHDQEQIISVLNKVNNERHQAETTFNHSSSRSHVIFRRVISRPGVIPIIVSIVDLAGCERTKTIGTERIRESCNINKSMLVLGRCIRALSSKNNSAVPYRESLITRLFKDFFESPGKCAVAGVIINVTPSMTQFEDTNFSLSFAVDASDVYLTSINSESEKENSQISNEERHEIESQIESSFNDIENNYKIQLEEIMNRNRGLHLLQKQISDAISINEFEKLKAENEMLRKQLKEALETIEELKRK